MSLVLWCIANWQQILESLAIVVASASALIKAIEMVVGLLAKVFPGLIAAEGKLAALVGWLDALSKSKWLAKASLAPKTVPFTNLQAVPNQPAKSSLPFAGG